MEAIGEEGLEADPHWVVGRHDQEGVRVGCFGACGGFGDDIEAIGIEPDGSTGKLVFPKIVCKSDERFQGALGYALEFGISICLQ